MKAFALTVALTLLTGAASAASPRDTVTAFHGALAAGDKAKVLEILAPEVLIYESGYVERSRDEYARHHLGDDIEFAKTSQVKPLQQGEHINGDTALLWQETETKGTSHGKPVHAYGTETVMLVKRGDAWLITHVHWSSRKAK